nr:MAG TPA: hypothetical protein [Caudoviricetes sp.]
MGGRGSASAGGVLAELRHKCNTDYSLERLRQL